MHLVTKSYFDAFCAEFNPPFKETKNFEAFSNYCVFSKHSADSVDPTDLVYDGADPGIDGAFVFIEDRAVFSISELNDLLSSTKREMAITIVMTQVKSSTSWQKKEIDSFAAAMVDLLSESPAQPHSEYLAEFREIFQAVYANIGRVKGGRPNIKAFFVTAAPLTDATEIVAAFLIGQKALETTGLFSTASFEMAHRDVIHEMWLGINGSVEAMLTTVGYAPFPAAPSIANAYVATVRARDFIDTVLKNTDGSVRKKLFEENVRDFLGADAEVNSEISDTLADKDKSERFGLMNNGVTIVASDVRVAGLDIFIKDFQIVNGCQTSNMLIAEDDNVDDGVSLMVKLIQADDANVIDDIVRATNRQSKVEDSQFISTMAFLKTLETYFRARGEDEANRLYFERRKGQYGPEGVAAVRIFDVRETARCFAATSLMRPDLASRYPNRLTGELLDEVYSEENGEEAYYTSCYALYRLKLLISNKRIEPRYSKLRWHILCATSKYCARTHKNRGYKDKFTSMYSLFSANDGSKFEELLEVIETSIPVPDVSRDVLKSPPFTTEMLSRLDAFLT